MFFNVGILLTGVQCWVLCNVGILLTGVQCLLFFNVGTVLTGACYVECPVTWVLC